MKKKLALFMAFLILLGMIIPVMPQSSYGRGLEDEDTYPTGLEEVKKTIHAGTDEHPIKVIGADGKEHIIDGSGTAVAVIDDALAIDHPGLSVKPKNPKRGTEKVISLGDYSADNGKNGLLLPWDNFHGLHIAGIIGGNGPASDEQGAPIFKGVAPETQIIFAKTKDFASQIAKDDKIEQAIQDAVNAGADSINLSLGTESATSNNSIMLQNAINEAVASGTVVVATAGNEGYLGFPTTKPNVTAPDYGIVASPGLFKETMCAMCFDVPQMSSRYFVADDSPKTLRVKDRRSRNRYPEIEDKKSEYIYVDSNRKYFKESDFPENQVRDKFVVFDLDGPEYAATNYGDISPGYIGAAIMLKEKGARGVIAVESPGDNLYPHEKIFLWDNSTKKYEKAPKDIYDKVEKYPIIGLTYEDGHSLIEHKQGTITLASKFGIYQVPTANQVTDFSSWGMSSDMVFKPDMGSSAGYAVWSLGNYKDDEGKMRYNLVDKRGTSMSAPQISAAAALVKQRLKLQYPDLVGNKETVRLIKNLLMSTSVPMKDDQSVYFSPRAQGNGMLQIREACMSDVVAVSPIVDGDLESGFAKTNLRSIGTNKVSFDVELENYGTKPHMFNAPELTVITDIVKDNKFQMHSTVLDNNRLSASTGNSQITVPARDGKQPGIAKVTVSFDLSQYDKELKEKASAGYWIDGFLTFTSAEAGGINLCHSFTGFKGDWFSLDGYDPFVYNLKSGEKPLYNDPKFKGLHTTSLLTLMGYDEKDNAKKEILGALPDFTAENLHVDKNKLAISPNEDSIADYVEPRYIMIRNFKNIKVNITDEKGTTVFARDYGTGNTDNGKNFNAFSKPFTENNKELRWNGKVHDEVKEGLYHINLKVTQDIIDHTNPIVENQNLQDPVQEENFDIKVDVTKPTLQPTEVVSEDGENTTFKIFASDPKLQGTDIDGSGIYKASIITSSKRLDVSFDPSKESKINGTEFTLPTKEFKNAKIELIDWARNKATYSISSIQSGMEMGHLSITSTVPSENREIGVKYMLEDIYSGKIYKNYADIPVGEYEIIPYDIPEGYQLVGKDQEHEIHIEKDQTYQRTFKYERTDEIGKVVFSEAVQGTSAEYARKNNIALELVNIESGTPYVAELSGNSYNFSIPYGTYKIRFLNATAEDKAMAYDQENTPTSYVKVEGISGTYYTFGFQGQNPGALKEFKPSISENYYEGKTYMKVTAKANQEIKITAYPYDEKNYAYDFKNPFTIDKSNADIKMVENLTSGHKKDYYIDLHDETIQKLKPGMLLEVQAIDRENPSLAQYGDEVAVVGYNEALNAQRLEAIKEMAEKKKQEGVLSEEELTNIFEKSEDLYGDMKDTGSMLGYDRFIHWKKDQINYYAGNGGYYIYDIGKKMSEFESNIKEKIGIADSLYPITYIHGGKLKNVRNILFRVYGDEQVYNGSEDVMTSFIPNEVVIRRAVERLMKEALADPNTNENTNMENQNQLDMIPIVKQFMKFESWEGKGVQLINPKEQEARVDMASADSTISDIFLRGAAQDFRAEKQMLEELKKKVQEAKDLYEAEKDQHSQVAGHMLLSRIKKSEEFIADPILTESAIQKEKSRLEKTMEMFKQSKKDDNPMPTPNPTPTPIPNPTPVPQPTPNPTPIPIPLPEAEDDADGNWWITLPHKKEEKQPRKESVLQKPQEKRKNISSNLNIPKPVEQVSFNDIAKSPFMKEIQDVAARGIIKGIGKNQFDPKGTLERTMIVEILYRMTVDKSGSDTEFKDVTKEDWFYDSVHWAVKHNIVIGYEDGTFRPHQPISRQELAVIMQKFLQYQQLNLTAEKSFDLQDRGTIPYWSKVSVEEMYKTGIVNARDAKVFGPTDSVKREEFAATVENLIQKIEK